LDLDILLFGDLVLDEPNLTIPHPRMTQRRFVLIPLAQIAPEVIHPLASLTILSLLDSCQDPSSVILHSDLEGSIFGNS
ncbi:2-amino-4-hydroxy-6-hydroxymethyldihydropteridine diphosphokinase, partial [Salmonella enterica]|uniref:2-amino-4-hydroxy-6- hydroxymethyldihydropteridine diphosphokinase n=1 Tax=Salmonella enterica TaxID=28901 RepID=UPI003523548A